MNEINGLYNILNYMSGGKRSIKPLLIGGGSILFISAMIAIYILFIRKDEKYRCFGGICIETPLGTYPNKNACEERCTQPKPGTKYECSDGECKKSTTGEYNTKADCEKDCSDDQPKNKYECDAGECIRSSDGIYPTKTECEDDCSKTNWEDYNCSEWEDNPRKTNIPDECYTQIWNKVGCTNLPHPYAKKVKLVPQSFIDGGVDTYINLLRDSGRWTAYLNRERRQNCYLDAKDIPDPCASFRNNNSEKIDVKCAAQIWKEAGCTEPSPHGQDYINRNNATFENMKNEANMYGDINDTRRNNILCYGIQ